ncbi:RNase H family protein [Candidatus Shikimatogenerans silvanidophilus]|uniref:RNase H family protein n=1 Tax=Candidatus Shikimatogenerans silvanidophilus TaxID=2782547 RepID=UPI001BA77698|nr:RNase H family protein [Candidatus Shikimatogenerans silvanidophilus]
MFIPSYYVYTDGSSKGNPGPGGYGIIIENIKNKIIKKISEGYYYTTNNRMELLSVIVSLEEIKKISKKKKEKILIFSDSKYVINPIIKNWINLWKKNFFKKRKNFDLWIRFLKIYEKKNVNFKWIKGHKNEKNIICHNLAISSYKEKNKLKKDFFFQKINNNF